MQTIYLSERMQMADEGRGPFLTHAAFTKEGEAHKFCYGLEPYSNPGQTTRIERMVLHDLAIHHPRFDNKKYQEMMAKINKNSEQAALQMSGLAKLTPEERKALGLKL